MASTLMEGSSWTRAPSGMQSPRLEEPSVLMAGKRKTVRQELSVANDRAWSIRPCRIS
jgi:hypothetical protein